MTHSTLGRANSLKHPSTGDPSNLSPLDSSLKIPFPRKYGQGVRPRSRQPQETRSPDAGRAGSQSVQTVEVKRRAGGGDVGGASVVEGANSESPEELLEGQAFEAGIVSEVKNASDPNQGEVRTHEVPHDEVPHDDVPEEYDAKDRP